MNAWAIIDAIVFAISALIIVAVIYTTISMLLGGDDDGGDWPGGAV